MRALEFIGRIIGGVFGAGIFIVFGGVADHFLFGAETLVQLNKFTMAILGMTGFAFGYKNFIKMIDGVISGIL